MTTLIIENSNTIKNLMAGKLTNVFIINMNDRSEIYSILETYKNIDLIIVDITEYYLNKNCLDLLQSHVKNKDVRVIFSNSKENSDCLINKFKSNKYNLFIDLYMNCSKPLHNLQLFN